MEKKSTRRIEGNGRGDGEVVQTMGWGRTFLERESRHDCWPELDLEL